MMVWLADVLQGAGVRVVEVEGWRTRGLSMNPPRVVIAHHTATRPSVSDAAMVRLLRDGRPDLPGPLAHVGLARDGTAYLIAAGRANHAGAGGWQGVTGNINAFGIEGFNDGVGERWPQVQLDAYDRVAAAVLQHEGRGALWLCGHREWAPQRKIDPTGIDLDQMRDRVQALLEVDDMWQYITVDAALVDHAFTQGWVAGDKTYWLGKLGNLADPEWVNFKRAVTNGLVHTAGAGTVTPATLTAAVAAHAAHPSDTAGVHMHGHRVVITQDIEGTAV